MTLIPWARDLAQQLLAEPLPRRWAHTQGVAHKAESIAHIVGEDADLLICAAWLHDIGYSPGLVASGFHPLDGARYLRDAHSANDLLCRLVAHHTCSLVEARSRGLSEELKREFSPMSGPLIETLTYCDITTSPDGHPVDLNTRLNEIIIRYGQTDVVSRSIEEARPHLEQAVHTVSSSISPGARPTP